VKNSNIFFSVLQFKFLSIFE
jgi:hypothetical protein